MMPFSKCPVCGGELSERNVEKLLRGGIHTAVLTVHAEVCLNCGERLYTQETVRRFEQIRAKLEKQEVADFIPLGQSFQIAQAAQVMVRATVARRPASPPLRAVHEVFLGPNAASGLTKP